MHSPLHPRTPPSAYTAPVPVRPQYLGTDTEGRPVYGAPATAPVAPLPPIKIHPWGAYIAGGMLAVVLVFLLVVGLAILALAVAACALALTTCALVLRSIWNDVQREKEY